MSNLVANPIPPATVGVFLPPMIVLAINMLSSSNNFTLKKDQSTVSPPSTNILINHINNPYVLTFSTAAGKESEERQEYWENLANIHFKSLNVRHKHIKANTANINNCS